MVPYKDGKANRGHSCVKGRFAWGYANHRDRILKPMIRETHRPAVARGDLGRGDRPRRLRVQAPPGQVRPRWRSAASPRRAAPTRRPTWCRSWCAAASATTTSIPVPASAIRRPATASGQPSAPRPAPRTSTRSSTPMSSLVIGANPTDAHPVFASRMKKRLRQGAKLIVIDPRRIDLVRMPHVEAAVPSAAAAGHQRRDPERDRPRHRHRGPGRTRSSSASAATSSLRALGGLRAGAAEQPRDGRPDDRRFGRGDPRRRPALCHRRQQRDLLRPRRHRAQPGHDGGDGARQPRHGDRQSRPAGRRREPAARPEQRPGLVRHGLVPARAVRLPPHLRRRHAHACSRSCGAVQLDAEPGLRIPNMFDAAIDGTFKGIYVQGEDILQSDPNTAARHARRWRRWNASSCRTCS